MSEKMPDAGTGLFASLSSFAANFITIVFTRLELLSVELEEEREHLFLLMVLVLAAVFCLGVAIVLATILLVVVFWDTHRLLVLGLLTATFLVAGILVWAYAMHKAKMKPRLFASSLAELNKDRQQIGSGP